MCETVDGLSGLLSALRSGHKVIPGQFGCLPFPDGWPVSIVSVTGVMDRWAEVKVEIWGGEIAKRWTPEWALRN